MIVRFADIGGVANRSFSYLGSTTSINNGGVKLVVWAQSSLLVK